MHRKVIVAGIVQGLSTDKDSKGCHWQSLKSCKSSVFDNQQSPLAGRLPVHSVAPPLKLCK
jgi:hypothetical protein